MKHFLSLIVLISLPACATSTGADGDSALMGLADKPATAVWRDWTPRAQAGIVPEAFAGKMVAFDYWQIDDEEVIEESWAGVSAVIDYLRRDGLPDAQDHTATLLLQLLDGRHPPAHTRMDVTYVVSLDQTQHPSEGLVVRLYTWLDDKEVAPGVAIYMGRRSGTRDAFDAARLWTSPNFEQAAPFTIALDPFDGAWMAHKLGGKAYPAGRGGSADAERQTLDGAANLTHEIFASRFWRPLTGPHFVEAKPRAQKESPLPAGVGRALGLEVRERQLEEVYKDTVFPPRVEVPAQFR